MTELALAQPSCRGDAPGEAPAESSLVVERRGAHSACCTWSIASFATSKQKTLWSRYFEVGGFDCRLLVYPTGDSQALPGYVSVYLQISDPGNNNSKWDCFASYRLSVRNLVDENKSVHRDSWHRFSAKKKSHGWCDFAALNTVLDPKQGFLGPGDTIQISTDITILHESVTFTRESDLSGAPPSATGDVYSGKFVWRVHNFSAFQPLLKTQKIMSPGFPAGDCLLRLSVYQSTVSSTDYLSVCLESKDTDKTGPSERTCWCLFRLAVTSQSEEAGRQVHKDSYGRFAADSKAGDNTSLGWNDFMRMSDFLAPEGAYLVGDTAVFSTTFHVIREYTSLSRNLEARAAQGVGQMVRYKDKRKLAARESDFAGKFTWRIEHFTRLKDLLKKRKITGLCIKSKRFTIGGRDCRLIVYPRGQSQPPTNLSMFLEVCDPRAPSPDWTCFVSHRLAVVNQKAESEKSVSKESQNRYSKTAKDWGWREFVSLTTLFDADAGFLVNDAVVFAAEVLVLRESCDIRHVPLLPSEAAATGQGPPSSSSAAAGAAAPALPAPPQAAGGAAPECELAVAGQTPPVAALAAEGGGAAGGTVVPADSEKSKTVFSWRIENFQAFKDIMETRKIFSKFFSVGPCDLRIGLYESFESLCLYLESDVATAPPSQQAGPAADAAAEKPPNYWVRYRMAVLNQRHPEKTEWKEAAICTRSWNNSVLQFMRVPSVAEGDAGYIMRDSLAITCEVLECCPWLDFAEGELSGGSAAEGPPLPSSGGAVAGAGTGAAAAAAAAAAAEKALSLSQGGESEVDEEDEVGYSDEATDEDDEVDSDVDLGDDEDTVSGWLAAAGVQLAAGGEVGTSAPLIPDPPLVRRALAATLLHQPGAVPMFVSSLRMYMDTLAKVKCLLMPGVITSRAQPAEAAESGATTSPNMPAGEEAAAAAVPAAPVSGSSLMHVLMGLPQLQQPLLGMLLDVMLDHCLTARMHKHQLHKQQGAAAAAAAAAIAAVQQQAAEEPAAAEVVGRPGGTSPGAPRSLDSSSSSGGRALQPGEEGAGASSGYATSEESSYEDAFEEGLGEAAAHWADDALQEAMAAAAAVAEPQAATQQQLGSGAAQSLPNGTLRGLTPLPPRKQAQAAAASALSAAAPSAAGDLADAGPAAAEQVAAEAARHDEPRDAADAATDLETDEESGSVCPSVGEVEQVVALILGWLRGLEPSLLQPLPAKGGVGGGARGAGGGAVMRAPLSSLQKVSMLLADAPRALQPDIIMLVPRLVDPLEHTAAAGTLLGRLAEASREGAEAETELRMPVLAALGMLRIDPAVADKVLHAALEALPSLSESELPPAVGLALKLASESELAPAAAVRVVRQRVRTAGGASSAGTLDAVRLAVLQHCGVARAMLADMESDAREALALGAPPPALPFEPPAPEAASEAPASSRRRRASSAGSASAAVPGPASIAAEAAAAAAAAVLPAPPHLQLQTSDMEVLLDLLSLPDLQAEAAQTVELCTAAGTLNNAEMAVLVERRRLQQLVASTLPLGSGPALPARSGLQAGDSVAAQWQQQQQQPPSAGGGPFSNALPPREEAAGVEAPAASATLLSALSLLEGQSGVGRLGPVGSAASAHAPPLPSLAAVLPLQPPASAAAAAPAAALPGSPLVPATTAAQPGLGVASSAAAAADEFGGLVLLAEMLQQSGSERCRSFSRVLYRTLFRLYSDEASVRRLLRGLVHQALGTTLPQQPQQASSSPALSRAPSVGPSRPGSASSVGAPVPGSRSQQQQQAQPQAEEAQQDGASTAAVARWTAGELLSSLLAEQPAAAGVVVGLSIEAARAAAQQSEALQRQLGAREAVAARELAAARDEAARQAASKNRHIERAAELDTQLTRLKAEHRAELAGLASDKKELQTQIRHLETQLEWVRGERDEERARQSREGREAAQRAAEAEAQLTRLKGQRREEQKRWQKEKAALGERVKELEERQKGSEQEAARLRSEVSTAAHRHDKAGTELRRRCMAAEKAAAEHEVEAAKARSIAAEAEAKLRGYQDAVRKLERRLAEEVGRSAAVLHGVGLESLGPEDLETLGRLHDQGLKRVNAALTKRGRTPVGTAPAPEAPLTRSASPSVSGGASTPVPSAAASPIDVAKAGYRAAMGVHQQQQHGGSGAAHHGGVPAHHGGGAGGPPSPSPLPPAVAMSTSAATSLHVQLQSLGAATGSTGGGQPGRPLSLNSSLDSLQSLGSVGSASSLFSGPWGSSVHSMSALQQAAANSSAAAAARGQRPGQAAHSEPAGSAAMDAANMEKLMGLLPSDLLHS